MFPAIALAFVLAGAAPAHGARAASAVDLPVFASIAAGYSSGAVAQGIARADSVRVAARASGDGRLESAAVIYGAIGLNWSRKFSEALAAVDARMPALRAQSDPGCLAFAQVTRAYALDALRRPEEAVSALKLAASTASAAGRTREVAFARLRLGWHWLQAGRRLDAAREYRLAIRAARDSDLESIAATAHVGLGIALNQSGDPVGAQREYYAALRSARLAGARVDEADALFNLGCLQLTSDDGARALPLLRSAAAVYRRLGNLERIVSSSRTLAIAELAQGNVAGASALLQSVWRESGTRLDPQSRGRLLSQLAIVRRLEQRPREARALAREALQLADSASAIHRAEFTLAAASVFAHTGSPDSALAILDGLLARIDIQHSGRALERAELARASMLVQLGRPQEAIGQLRRFVAGEHVAGFLPGARADVATGVARAHLAIGNPDSAATWYEHSLRFWEESRKRASSVDWRESYDAHLSTTSSEYVRLLLADPRFGARPARIARAFDIVQRFRGRTLNELRSKSGSSAPPITCATLRRRTLEPGEIFLDFHYQPDTTIVFAIARDSVAAWGAPGTTEFHPRMLRLQEALGGSTERSGEVALATGSELGRLLLGPGAGMIARARSVVLTAGGLSNLPWGMLVLPGEPEPLALRRTTCACPSATLLDELRSPAGRSVQGNGTFIAACSHDGEGRPLPGVLREMREVADVWKGARVVRDRAIGGAAGLLAGARGADIVHVAAHARTDQVDGWTSAILVGDSGRPGDWLDAAAIAGARTQARLCVTSACGSIGATWGESLRGLATAWIAAGARSVVAMEQDANDESSAELMIRFHRGLATGLTTGEALRRAQREVKAMPRFAAPAHWSGVVLLGDPSVRFAAPRARSGGSASPSAVTPAGLRGSR